MLSVELYQAQIPRIFNEFRTLIGDGTWIDAATRLARDIRTWPYLRDYLQDQHRIVIHLCECSLETDANGGQLPWSLTAGALSTETFVFAFQVVDLVQAARRISNKRGNILIARVREALRRPRMLQAMQLEARVATHFLRGGYQVAFPELGNGRETFDLLVEDLGAEGLELEAKVITRDKGKKIHLIESRHALCPLLSSPLMQACASNLRRGLAVRITVSNRLPKDLDSFRAAIAQQILSGCSGALNDGAEVRMFDFDVSDLGTFTQPASQQTIEAIEKITGSANSHLAIMRPPGAKGVLALSLDSATPDSVLHETFATFAESAASQLTGNRAGAFMASFEGMSSDMLLNVAQGEGANGKHSGLAWAASKFLERPEFPHIVGVGFLSEPDYATADTAIQGVSYWIPKPISPFWSPAFTQVFKKLPRGPATVLSAANVPTGKDKPST